jgi:tetratricopeptide (TPR) repeat protein
MPSNLQQASSALQRGNLGRAGTLLEQLRLTDTSNPKVWLLSASYYHQNGDRDSALHDLHTANSMALNEPETRQQVLQAYMNLQAWEQAMQLLQQLDPQQRQFPLEHARCLWGLGEYEQSLQRWQQYAKALPEVADAQFRLWQCLERLGITADADAQRNLCQRWAGSHLGISMMELAHLVAEQSYQQAWTLLQHGFTRLGDDTQPLINAAVCLAEWPGAADCKPSAIDSRRMLEQINNNGQALLSSQRWLLQQQVGNIYGNSTRMLQAAAQGMPATLSASGLVMEFGVFHGRSISIIADSLHLSDNSHIVHGFDSFAGLPEAWNNEPAGSYNTHGQLPAVPDNVQLHQGWFNETLDAFLAEHGQAVALAHLDCDLYSSTRDVLQRLSGRCRSGSIIVFDELIGYPGYEQHELRAFKEFMQGWPGSFRVIGASFMGRAVAVQLSE